jgi:hypothetical protein
MSEKFEVGKFYQRKSSKIIYECLFCGEELVFFKRYDGEEDHDWHSNYRFYEEYTPPKVEVRKMYAHVDYTEGLRGLFADHWSQHQTHSNEPFYLTFTDEKLTAVSLTDPMGN